MYLLSNLKPTAPYSILTEATEKVTSQQEGFISANIHKSLDGTRVVNYAQWKSKEAFEKMLKNPRAIVHMNDALSVAKSDGSLYEVVFVDNISSKGTEEVDQRDTTNQVF